MIDGKQLLAEMDASGMREKEFWRTFYPHLTYGPDGWTNWDYVLPAKRQQIVRAA